MELNDLESQGSIERVEPNPGNVKKALERAQRDFTEVILSTTKQKTEDLFKK